MANTPHLKLADFYKDNIHKFYNIDIIEDKYKQQRRYKTIPEITKYMRTEIFDLENNDIKDNITRDNVKSALYGLFDKKIIKKEITTEQLIQIIELINGKKPRTVTQYAKDKIIPYIPPSVRTNFPNIKFSIKSSGKNNPQALDRNPNNKRHINSEKDPKTNTGAVTKYYHDGTRPLPTTTTTSTGDGGTVASIFATFLSS